MRTGQEKGMARVRGKLEEVVASMEELQEELEVVGGLSLVCSVKQEMSAMAQRLEEVRSSLASPTPVGEAQSSRRWWCWPLASSLILGALLSFTSILTSSLQPLCCSDHQASTMAWTILSNPVTFAYINGPPPI